MWDAAVLVTGGSLVRHWAVGCGAVECRLHSTTAFSVGDTTKHLFQ